MLNRKEMLYNTSLAETTRGQNTKSNNNEKTDILGFRPGATQTGMYTHRSRLETFFFGFKKKRKFTFCISKIKGNCIADLRLWFRICSVGFMM